MSDTNEIDRYRAALNHVLPLARTEAKYGTPGWQEAVIIIEAALVQDEQRGLELRDVSRSPLE